MWGYVGLQKYTVSKQGGRGLACHRKGHRDPMFLLWALLCAALILANVSCDLGVLSMQGAQITQHITSPGTGSGLQLCVCGSSLSCTFPSSPDLHPSQMRPLFVGKQKEMRKNRIIETGRNSDRSRRRTEPPRPHREITDNMQD